MVNVEIKTRDDVLDNAKEIFKTAPFLVDLALALCAKDRRCVINLHNGASGGCVAWGPKEGDIPQPKPNWSQVEIDTEAWDRLRRRIE